MHDRGEGGRGRELSAVPDRDARQCAREHVHSRRLLLVPAGQQRPVPRHSRVPCQRRGVRQASEPSRAGRLQHPEARRADGRLVGLDQRYERRDPSLSTSRSVRSPSGRSGSGGSATRRATSRATRLVIAWREAIRRNPRPARRRAAPRTPGDPGVQVRPFLPDEPVDRRGQRHHVLRDAADRSGTRHTRTGPKPTSNTLYHARSPKEGDPLAGGPRAEREDRDQAIALHGDRHVPNRDGLHGLSQHGSMCVLHPRYRRPRAPVLTLGAISLTVAAQCPRDRPSRSPPRPD